MIRSSGRPYVSKYCKFQWIAGGSGGGGGGGWGGGYTRGGGGIFYEGLHTVVKKLAAEAAVR